MSWRFHAKFSRARFPTYGFFRRRKTGSHDEDAENLWLVDPIDGTKAFVREYPMFSTQIALDAPRRRSCSASRKRPVRRARLCRAWPWRVFERQTLGGQLRCRSVESAALSAGQFEDPWPPPPTWARYGALVARASTESAVTVIF